MKIKSVKCTLDNSKKTGYNIWHSKDWSALLYRKTEIETELKLRVFLCAIYFFNSIIFRCHEESPLIHPVGWARRVGHQVVANQDYFDRCAMDNLLTTDCTPDMFPEYRQAHMTNLLPGTIQKIMYIL